MFNLLRMEIKRLFNQSSTYIIILIAIVSLIAYDLLIDYNYQQLSEQIASEQMDAINENPERTDESVEFNVSADPAILETSGEELFIEQVSGYGFIVFLIVFFAIFYTAPYRHGFIKNFIGLKNKRYGFIISEFLISVFYSFLLFVIGSATLFLAQNYLMRSDFVIHDLINVLKLTGVQFVLHLSFSTLLLFLATLTGSVAAVLAISMIWVTILHRPVLDILTTGLSKIFNLGDDFTLRSYTVTGNIGQLDWGADQAGVNQALIVALCLALIALTASAILLQKKDIA